MDSCRAEEVMGSVIVIMRLRNPFQDSHPSSLRCRAPRRRARLVRHIESYTSLRYFSVMSSAAPSSPFLTLMDSFSSYVQSREMTPALEGSGRCKVGLFGL